MSIIPQLASSLDRKDEEPNIELAQKIVAVNDTSAVHELVEHLTDKNKAIRHDCIKVLYEIGDRQPTLIADHVQAFIDLIQTKDNRMVWGAMTALGSIATLKADEIGQHIKIIMRVTEKGSVITQDWGVRVLATVAAQSADDSDKIFPFLLDFLKMCRPKDLPRHSESTAVAINADNLSAFISLLESRKPALQPPQLKRIEKLLKHISPS